MEILTITFVNNNTEQMAQAVIQFDHNGKAEHTVCRMNLNQNDINALTDLLGGLDFVQNCDAAIAERKKIIDNPEIV